MTTATTNDPAPAPTIEGALADYRRAADALAYVATFAGLTDTAGVATAGPVEGSYVAFYGDPDLADAAALAATVAAAAARLASILAAHAAEDAEHDADVSEDVLSAATWRGRAVMCHAVARAADDIASRADAAARDVFAGDDSADVVGAGMLAASVAWPALAVELGAGDAGAVLCGRRFAAQLYAARDTIADVAGMLDGDDDADDDGGTA